ncbi:interleukin-1 receptor-like 2 [Ctenodactylus gundi]
MTELKEPVEGCQPPDGAPMVLWEGQDCHEITRGHRFVSSGMKLYVNNVTAEDQGSYSCTARLTHTGNVYMVFNNISVSTESIHHGRRIPKIIYPKNNSIEVKLGSTLIVDCNITDVRGNSNLRCWTVNNTQVDEYYKDSKRIQEGIETNTSFQGHIFYTVNITFLEVKMEDYGLPFMCHAGVSTAYVMLTLPAPDLRAYLMAALMGLAVLVALALGVYNSFRIDLVLWYRSTFSAAKAPEDGKLYDAYVLYPKPPRTSQACLDALVLQALPEVLERQCGYTLFIFGRDEIPGQAVASVIDENTRLCRRLIVILAPESPGSSLWKNMSEGQIAVYSALVQDGLKVILIELGRIEDYSAMPQSIQYIRQKHGSVRWSGDVMAPPQSARTKFWKEVRYRMPPRRFPPPPPGQPPPTHTLPSWGTEEGGRHRDGHPLTELRPPGGSPRAGRAPPTAPWRRLVATEGIQLSALTAGMDPSRLSREGAAGRAMGRGGRSTAVRAASELPGALLTGSRTLQAHLPVVAKLTSCT